MDVSASLADLESARAAERESLSVLRDTEAKLEGARRVFSASPSADLEEAVEQADRVQRRAQRFASAHTSARERAEQVHAEALRAAALVRLGELKQARADLLGDVRNVVTDAERVYEQLVGLVAGAHALVDRDRALVDDARAAAEAARVEFRDEPLSLSVLRVAVGVRLAEEWELPELPAVDRSSSEFQRVLESLAAEPGTAAQRRARLHRVAQAGIDLFGAEAGDWLALVPPPDWNAGGTLASRYASARRLLQMIDTPTEEDENG